MTAKKYAHGTTVTVERSKAEIETTLRRYGAESFVSGFDSRVAFVIVQIRGVRLRFHVTIPVAEDKQFSRTGHGSIRGPVERQRAAEAEERRLWRCLLLAIKAKFEVVESGIETFEQAFLANIVLPGGATVGEWVVPQVEESYRTGELPSMLPALGAGADL